MAIALFTNKPEIRTWSILILLAWIGAVAIPGIIIAVKTKSDLSFRRRLATNAWVKSFFFMLVAACAISFIFWFKETNRITAAAWTSGLMFTAVFIGVALFAPPKNKQK